MRLFGVILIIFGAGCALSLFVAGLLAGFGALPETIMNVGALVVTFALSAVITLFTGDVIMTEAKQWPRWMRRRIEAREIRERLATAERHERELERRTRVKKMERLLQENELDFEP